MDISTRNVGGWLRHCFSWESSFIENKTYRCRMLGKIHVFVEGINWTFKCYQLNLIFSNEAYVLRNLFWLGLTLYQRHDNKYLNQYAPRKINTQNKLNNYISNPSTLHCEIKINLRVFRELFYLLEEMYLLSGELWTLACVISVLLLFFVLDHYFIE